MPRKTKPTRARKLSWIAHHEAAHKVASIRFGYDTYGVVTIKPSGETLGRADGEDPLDHAGRLEGGVWVPDPAGVEKGIIGLYAGAFAAIKAGQERRAAWRLACDDLDKIADRVGCATASRAALRQRAFRFVERNWKAIRALAAELLRFETLDDCEPELIVELADGRRGAAAELAQFRALRGPRPRP